MTLSIIYTEKLIRICAFATSRENYYAELYEDYTELHREK
ncbi:hypothetical protein ADIWIN_2493 [Winogradskyella psychrotolerans RS-3]|uniref:Uncharacterized protein n=1 Tax=Winogradskyella psychrotolerans RS-3 TaxID=641526 RepID=S7X8G1_9FLAO|nr:hypothetical protein ADIWIN_2493 [Winogradskyella psychrotolerans RS-3]